MNAKFLLLTLAAALPLCVLASPPQPITITVDCKNPAWPTLRQIADHAGYDAFNPPYLVRQQLMLESRRACKRGATNVRLVYQPLENEQSPVLTRIDTTR